MRVVVLGLYMRLSLVVILHMHLYNSKTLVARVDDHMGVFWVWFSLWEWNILG